MPEAKTIKRAEADKRQGKSAMTQAGEFVKEQMDHIRQGKHGARSTKQAIAIGLSEARRAGVDLPPPKRGKATEKTRQSAERDWRRGHGEPAKRVPSEKRSKATKAALKRESTEAASHESISRQARAAARRRSPAERSASANQAVQTKGHEKMVQAARKAAKTRATRQHK